MDTARTPLFPWRRALVIGLGRSGLAAARLLHRAGVAVRVYDRRAPDSGTLPPGIEGHTGEPEVPEAAFAGIDALVLSPGVPPKPVLARLRQFAPDAPVHGEMSVALMAAGTLWPDAPRVLITGTNGKSTVTALLGSVLEADGRRPFVGGNLGVPLSEAILAALEPDAPSSAPDALVLECSSYQLETIRPVPTAVAMVLNVAPDHMSRYDSMEHYATTKARVFAGLTDGGLALMEAGDPWTPRLRGHIPDAARLLTVAGDGHARIAGDGPGDALVLGDESYPRDALGLAGRHNSKNALFALAAARHLGVAPSRCTEGLRQFQGLPHRMVRVAEKAGVVYYNDSKATNVASVLASLDGFDRPYVLIAGGRLKGDDLTPIRGLLAQRGRGMIAIGEATSALLEAVGDAVPVARATSMEEAVHRAQAMAQAGDAVVLSPACSSFDWYDNFGKRGEDFTAIVHALENT